MTGAAFFDLDGTLLGVQSASLWLRRERRHGRVSKRQLVRAALFFVAYRFGVLDVEKAIGVALATVKGLEERELRAQSHAWYREEVARHAAPGAFAVLDAHRALGQPLVLVTSSSLYASEGAQEQFGLDAILCTRYETRDGRFTGAPLRPLCFGAGKVQLVEELAVARGIDLAKSAFYTDSLTDLPLLERVGQPFVVNPDPRLRWEAKLRHWPVLDWRSVVPRAAMQPVARPFGPPDSDA